MHSRLALQLAPVWPASLQAAEEAQKYAEEARRRALQLAHVFEESVDTLQQLAGSSKDTTGVSCALLLRQKGCSPWQLKQKCPSTRQSACHQRLQGPGVKCQAGLGCSKQGCSGQVFKLICLSCTDGCPSLHCCQLSGLRRWSALFCLSHALTYLPAWLQLDPNKLERLNIPLPKGHLLYMEDCKRQYRSSSHAIERASGLDPTDL